MAKNDLPLKEVSIDELFMSGETSVYEIPIYQRNYAWEKEEIDALIQDVYDAFKKSQKNVYYIGILVSYHKGDMIFEIIDGQQRLTTISLILGAFGLAAKNRLTYRARKRSDDTLKSIPVFDVEEKDSGIENGFRYARNALNELVPKSEKSEFEKYFRSSVHIIHYRVPKDIDLNHYFEIMNSRGEQLEKHEIVKANLMERLGSDSERKLFNIIWESCSEMSTYIQQNFTLEIFGNSLCKFHPASFDEMIKLLKEDGKEKNLLSINEILDPDANRKGKLSYDDNDRKDSFQPIIDFPNFLLIVLKITQMGKTDFDPLGFQLDDKELLNELRKAELGAPDIKMFAYNLLKARFLLDNYIIHHSKEDDTMDSNPWKLQVWYKNDETKKGMLRNLCDNNFQDYLVQILSMFEVSFTARQRKNYLFYTLMYLMEQDEVDCKEYADFVERLAERYFFEVYLDSTKLNEINTPLPGSFDEVVLCNEKLNMAETKKRDGAVFTDIYGDGSVRSKGIPLYIFNYLDLKIWMLYACEMRNGKFKEESTERKSFFSVFGCNDFGLKIFDRFYFSRTRRSLEHYYPQANATGENGALDENQINCFGNYAMIGSAANSSGSNWSPKTKLDHYLDKSGKINQISVASLKFMIMMQMCKDEGAWEFKDIKYHQGRMIDVLLEKN